MDTINYNEIAKLIISVNSCYNEYENTVRTINFHAALTDEKLNLEAEEINYVSFEKKYLLEKKKYYFLLTEKLLALYSELYYNVDSDDYK